MKKTLRISDTTFGQLEREAARRGETVSVLVETALQRVLDERPTILDKALEPLPSFDGGPAHVDIANRVALHNRMTGVLVPDRLGDPRP